MYKFGKFPLISGTFLIIAITFTKCISDVEIPLPPDPEKYVAMARYVVHQADWASLATLSDIPKIKGYPFSSVESMSDGPVNKSVGIPYFYLTPVDFAVKDLLKDIKCSISVTLEQTSYCRDQEFDPEDPRCARVMLTGKMTRLSNGTEEYDFAENAIFTRHPFMKLFPKTHNFYVAKLALENIVMYDRFDGAYTINIDEYLAYNDTKIYN